MHYVIMLLSIAPKISYYAFENADYSQIMQLANVSLKLH